MIDQFFSFLIFTWKLILEASLAETICMKTGYDLYNLDKLFMTFYFQHVQ